MVVRSWSQFAVAENLILAEALKIWPNSSLDQGHSTLKILLTAVHNLSRVILRVNKHAGSALEKTHIFDNCSAIPTRYALSSLFPVGRSSQIGSLYLLLKPKFETLVWDQKPVWDLINAKSKVTLSFSLRLSQTKLHAETKVSDQVWSDTKLNLSSSISDRSTAMHLDRQTA